MTTGEKIKPTPAACIYAAGFFEHSSFMIQYKADVNQFFVTIRALASLRETFNFLNQYWHIFLEEASSKKSYRIRFSGSYALKFNEDINPYLIEKKKQSDLLIRLSKIIAMQKTGMYDKKYLYELKVKVHEELQSVNIKYSISTKNKPREFLEVQRKKPGPKPGAQKPQKRKIEKSFFDGLL
jgi:hypothetical protein